MKKSIKAFGGGILRLLLPALLIASLVLVALPARSVLATDAWYSDNWSSRVTVTFDNSGQAENLINFPVWIKLTGDTFDLMSAQADGDDIVFTDSDGTTRIPHELVDFESDFTETWEDTTLNFAAIWVAANGDVWAGNGDYSGAGNGKIYKSTNGGDDWTLKYTIPGDPKYVRTVFIDSNDYIYVSGCFATTGNGLYRSIDDGANWTKVLATNTLTCIWRMAEDESGNILAAGYSSGDGTEHEARIYRSQNNGDSFTQVYYDAAARHMHGVWYDPYQDYFYASQGEEATAKLLRSVDGGTTWTTLKSGSVDWQMTAFIAGDGYRIWGEDAVPGGNSIVRTTDDVNYADEYSPGAPWRGNPFWGRIDNYGNLFVGITSGEWGATDKSSIVVSYDDGLNWSVIKDLGMHAADGYFGGSCWASNVAPDGFIYYANRDTAYGGKFELSSSGEANFWVKVPQIDSGSAIDYIYIYYNNPDATDSSDPASVWSDYVGVWHLDGSAGAVVDSTGVNDGSANGTLTREQTGKVGYCFSYTDGLVDIPDDPSLNWTDNLTFSTWVKITDNSTALQQAIGGKYATVEGDRREWKIVKDNDNGKIEILFGDPADGTSEGYATTDDEHIESGVWLYIALTYDAGAVIFYADGVAVADTQVTVPATLYNSNTPYSFGDDVDGLTPLVGSIDEQRIALTVRSALWIKAQYLVQTDAFVSAISAPLGAPTVTTQAVTTILADKADGNANITATGDTAVTKRGFQWDTDSGVPYDNEVSEEGIFGTGAFSLTMEGLPEDTTIYCRGFAENSRGRGYGGEVNFATGSSPAVATGGTVNIYPTSATIQGSLESLGDETSVDVSLEYGLTTSYGMETVEQTKTAVGGYSETLIDLSPFSTYHYRAVVRWDVDSYAYGSDMTFTTTDAPGEETDVWYISSGAVFENYLVDGDMLFIADVTNTYEPYYPIEDSANHFDFALYAVDGATLIAATPLVDWGRRPVAIYLSADMATPITRGNAYVLKLVASFDDLVSSYTLQPSDWYGTDLSYLDKWCIRTAHLMELTYDETLVTYVADRGEVLNSIGGVEFDKGISGLSYVRPELFQTVVETLTRTPETFTDAFEEATTWEAQVGDGVVSTMTDLGAIVGMDGKGVMQFLIIAVMVLMAFLTRSVFFGLMLTIPIGLWGLWMRVLPWEVVGVIGGVMIYIIVYKVWWSKT